MPCYTVQLTTVEFKAQHVELLRAALKSLGLAFKERDQQIGILGSYLTIDLANQKIIAERNETSLINNIKKAYSQQVLLTAAAKHKWFVKKLSDNKLALRRF